MKWSPSALNLFKSCPRCTWLEKNKNVKRPRGIMASLPMGMDRTVKKTIDAMRAEGKMFDILSQHEDLENVQFFSNQVALNKMRNWRSGLVYEGPEGTLSGALDDLLMRLNGESDTGAQYIPFDVKTKGSATTQADSEKYYTTQLDCYRLMLEANDMPCADFGILMYFTPEKMLLNPGEFLFNIQVIKVDTDPNRAKALVKSANECIKKKDAPEPFGDCEFCMYLSLRRANDVL